MSARGDVLWEPSADAWSSTALGRFATRHGFDRYEDLHRWSITDLEGFWAAVAADRDLIWRAPPERPLADGDRSMPGARWFPGGELNYAQHALRAAASDLDRVAVVARSQTRGAHELRGGELVDAVARCAAGLRRLGVERGDRVVAYAPNIAETLIAFLATASIGAIWSSCAPEFGTRSVIDRFARLEPAVLLAVDGYRYGDKVVDRTEQVAQIRAALPSLRHVVSIAYLGSGIVDAERWDDVLATADPDGPTYEAVPFDHPLYVLFSSGTTGLPKAIVHGHGGITLEHLKVLALHQDLGVDDRFGWFTTTGWMMWNYLVSGLLVGSTIVLVDGDPTYPDAGALWRTAAETACSVFGASAPFIMASRKAGLRPERGALRWLGSTGAPLPAAGALWVREAVGVPVSSISGGTDVCTAFVGSAPVVPVRAGEISCRLVGCAVEAYDPSGRAVPPGVMGELVVTAPMPSMPVRFWDDDHHRRELRRAYFEHFPGVWRHGDWITFSADGACTITGRSDATLNRGGVRLGTSDFYAVVEALPEIDDSLVVHLEDGGDDGGPGVLVLFVVLAPGAEMTDALHARIATELRSELSPRHVPDRIEVAPGIPRTLSGKKLEVPVKRILSGTPADETASPGSLTDPTALRWFEQHAGRTTR